MPMVQTRLVFTSFEDVFKWIENLEHGTTLMAWSEDMTIDGFMLCMRDAAEGWYLDLHHWMTGRARRSSREPCCVGLVMVVRAS